MLPRHRVAEMGVVEPFTEFAQTIDAPHVFLKTAQTQLLTLLACFQDVFCENVLI